MLFSPANLVRTSLYLTGAFLVLQVSVKFVWLGQTAYQTVLQGYAFLGFMVELAGIFLLFRWRLFAISFVPPFTLRADTTLPMLASLYRTCPTSGGRLRS